LIVFFAFLLHLTLVLRFHDFSERRESIFFPGFCRQTNLFRKGWKGKIISKDTG
jgi:hypothetical protein